MVISDVNRYVFVEVPQTASTTLAAELIEHYGGRRIFRKHTDYFEFLRSASSEERGYRVLATVRNPLDIVVSKFVKARDDHRNRYALKREGGAPWGNRFRPEARERAFITRHGSDFDAYVRKFYRRIYNSRACLLPDHADVLRFERLNEDFAEWLRALHLRLVRPLPRRHSTSGRDRDFTAWYQGELRGHAVRVFGPYMRRWGYEFPPGWPHAARSAGAELRFREDTALRKFYFRKVHYGWVMPRARRERRPLSPHGDGG
jgi:hypothetical protein